MHESGKGSLEIFLAAIISFHHWWWKYDNCIPLLMATLWAAISCWVCSCSNYVLSCWLNRQIKLDEQKAIHHGFKLKERRSSTGLILWSKFFIPHWTKDCLKIIRTLILLSIFAVNFHAFYFKPGEVWGHFWIARFQGYSKIPSNLN